ncbi:MAG: hypothetical protein ACYTE6_14800 [Planctomycetota bacterium]|jgi:hypothetical protein
MASRTLALHDMKGVTVFQVTEEAVAHAAYQLGEAGARKGTVIRLFAHESGLVLEPGRIEPGDVTFDHDGRPVIAVPGALVEDLRNIVLQAEETDEGTCLQLRERG